MTRTAWCVRLAIVLTALWPAPASAQTTVQYYHLDAVGSVRMITDQNGAVVAYHDYLPFGIETPAPTVADPRAFAGNERDQETGLDYLGARYYASQTGRFTSPDPITVDTLRIVNPQRWNRFVYGVNNPLKYVDSNGLDALLINYTDGANGLGHMGIVALNSDGSGLYGGFNPVHKGRPIDRGIVKHIPVFAGTSLESLRAQLAHLDGRSPRAIRIRRMKTSDTETAALFAYIQHGITAPSSYVVGSQDCLDFCVRGLRLAGIPAPPPSVATSIPDLYFQSFWFNFAIRLSESWHQPTPQVEISYCFQGIDCK